MAEQFDIQPSDPVQPKRRNSISPAILLGLGGCLGAMIAVGIVAAFLLTQGSDAPPRSQPSQVASTGPQEPPSVPEAPTAPVAPVLPATEPPSVGDMVEAVDDAVVFVRAMDASGSAVAVGSGCVISPDGLVATNRHVIREAAEVFVEFRTAQETGKRYRVRGYRAIDSHRDLAILQLDEMPDHVESFAVDADVQLRQGDSLIAIGHPQQFDFTVSQGILSAFRTTNELPEIYRQLHAAEDTYWIQSTAAISQGSSGGPLISERGQLVGLNTWIAGGQNLGFAVHVRHLSELQQHLSEAPQPFPLPRTSVIATAETQGIWADFVKEIGVLQQNMMTASQSQRARILQAQNPSPIYLERFFKLADEHRGEPVALDALLAACRVLGSGLPASEDQARQLLERAVEDHGESDRLDVAAWALRGASLSEPVRAFLQSVIQQNPHRAVQGTASYCLAEALMEASQRGQSDAPEVVASLERAVKQFGDVELLEEAEGVTVAEVAEKPWFAWKHLRVGSRAAEIDGVDLDGQAFRLSEYRGNIVLLDFWADWCPHCRAMYADERALLERHADDRFVILGINSDQRDRAEAVIARGDVTWRSWYDGPAGPICQAWQVASLPTTYLLDDRGVIRFEGVRGQDLANAVQALIEERQLAMPGDLIGGDVSWRYRYDVTPPGDDWRDVGFDDAEWAEGPAPLGYGSGLETTSIHAGSPNGGGPVTAYFRRAFAVDSTAELKRVVLYLRVDDGAVVYLNGQEVVRHNLPSGADADDLAIQQAKWHGQKDLYYDLATDLVRQGENVLAVEVHQASTTSADLYFEASLSSRLPAIPASENPLTLVRVSDMCAQLGTSVAAALGRITPWLKNADPNVRVAAMIAACQLDPQWTIEKGVPKARDAQETAVRKRVAEDLNERGWSVVRSTQRSREQLERAKRFVAAAHALLPEEANICNTLGVAQYRTGELEQSLVCLERSLALQGENPYDLAFIAMASCRLKNTERQAESFQRLQELMQEPKWADDAVAREFVDEAEALLKAAP